MPPSIPKEPPPSPPSPRSLLPTKQEFPPINIIHVGYTTNRKKQKHFFDGLAQAASTWVGRYGPDRIAFSVKLISFSDVDEIPLPENLALHAIIHKRTDDMAAAFAHADSEASAKLQRLDKLLSSSRPYHPQLLGAPPKIYFSESHHFPVVAVDPMEGVWRLVDRTKISEAVDRAFSPARCDPYLNCLQNVCTVAWTQVPVRQGPDAIRAALCSLRFPIILKRRLACGTKASHEMVIANDMEGALAAIKSVFVFDILSASPSSTCTDHAINDAANDFAADLIAQEFITNHGGVLFKVYAIGENILVQPRASVQHSRGPSGGYSCFDSQRLNRATHYCFDPVTGYSHGTEAVMPLRKLAAAIVAELSKELKLSLIGVDLVYDIHSKNYYVVDVNYFPGYKGVTNAYEWMLQHICNLVWRRFEEH